MTAGFARHFDLCVPDLSAYLLAVGGIVYHIHPTTEGLDCILDLQR